MSMLSTDRVAEVFVEFADTLVEEFDVVEFLQMVTTRAAELVDSAAAGLLLADEHGQLQFMAASDERTHLLELFQVQAVEGPCQDCFRLGTSVVNADLTHAQGRWPQFTPRALAAGFRSVHAFPLRLRHQVIGALNMFGTHEGDLEPADIRVIQALADIATIGLLQERAVREATVLSEQLQGALQSRISIEQAKGALAQIHGVGVDGAFDLMRSFARNNNRRLSAVARDVVLDPSNVAELTRP
jgi:GAF domain-containing protein